MPADTFSLPVLIRCQPYFITFFCQCFQVIYHLRFFRRNNILRLKIIVEVDAHIVLLQVSDMAVATLHFKVFS